VTIGYLPHTTVHGVLGLGYTRRTYRAGQTIIGQDGRAYVVSFVRDDGDVFGDGCPNLNVFTEPAPDNARVCQG
jgi:hypothetical protein